MHDHRLEVTVELRAKRIYWVRCDFAKPANETPETIPIFFHIGGNPNVSISACRVAAYQLPPR